MSLKDKLKGVEPFLNDPTVLLHPQIPQPLHGLAPRTILGGKWWDVTRKAAYRSTNFHCLACGIPKALAKSRNWLEGHETYEIDYLMGRMTYVRTVALCHFCHSYIHNGRLKWLLESGKVHQAKYVAIIQHGDSILFNAKLKRPEPYTGPTVEWKEWRLILDGKEYKPLYKNFEQWAKANREPFDE
jgi:hypothetical protein